MSPPLGATSGSFELDAIHRSGVSVDRRAWLLEHHVPSGGCFFRSQAALLQRTGACASAETWGDGMNGNLKQLTKRRPGSREEAAFVDLWRTCDLLSRGFAPLLKSEDISATQYNVLRILRGSPEGLPCGEIAGRMITRDPDVTRLLDRMEKRGLISRSRDTKDRRTVIGKITPEGLKLLARLDEPIQEIHRKQLGHLGRNRLSALTELLSDVRANVE
jgi:DNA-binding MarR family transcriptional regulator